MQSQRCHHSYFVVGCLACCFMVLLIVFRIDGLNGNFLCRQIFDLEMTKEKTHENFRCPVSTKHRRYAQANIDTALFEKFWFNPIKCYGTFVELGALDGNQLSNTKFFEDYLGWNGVLIEAYDKNYQKLKQNRPRTFNFNVAICKKGQGHVDFIGKGPVGGIRDTLNPKKIKQFNLKQGERLKVPCEPIGPLLRKSNITNIDLFSLDVEGSEFMVLQTMDWSIPTHVFVIEMEGTTENNNLIRGLMKSKGFVEIKNVWDINMYSESVYNEVFINLNYKY